MEPQQTTPTVPPPVVEQKPPHSNKMFKVLLLVFLILLLGAVVTYAFQNYQAQQTNFVPPTEPTPTQVVEEASEWKMYTSEEYGYTLQYPPDWKLVENGSKISIQELSDNTPWMSGEFTVSVSKKNPNLSLGEIAADLDKAPEPPVMDYYNIIGDITLDGYPAKQLSYFQFDSADIITIVLYKDYQYELKYNDGGSNDPKEQLHKQVYNQILSSFRFVEEEKASIEGWKVMSSDMFPVTFEYPSSWKRYSNVTNAQVDLQYEEKFVGESELIINENNCAIYLGYGGGGGPTAEITNESVMIDEKPFTKRVWYEEEKPVFVSYLTEATIQKFESLYTWISEQDSVGCQKTLDQILSTFKFLD